MQCSLKFETIVVVVDNWTRKQTVGKGKEDEAHRSSPKYPMQSGPTRARSLSLLPTVARERPMRVSPAARRHPPLPCPRPPSSCPQVCSVPVFASASCWCFELPSTSKFLILRVWLGWCAKRTRDLYWFRQNVLRPVRCCCSYY